MNVPTVLLWYHRHYSLEVCVYASVEEAVASASGMSDSGDAWAELIEVWDDGVYRLIDHEELRELEWDYEGARMRDAPITPARTYTAWVWIKHATEDEWALFGNYEHRSDADRNLEQLVSRFPGRARLTTDGRRPS